jgi:hypothetical protein
MVNIAKESRCGILIQYCILLTSLELTVQLVHMYILTVKSILLEKLYKSLKTISMIYCIYSIQRLSKAEDWYTDTRVCTYCPLCPPAFQWPASLAVWPTTINLTHYIC